MTSEYWHPPVALQESESCGRSSSRLSSASDSSVASYKGVTDPFVTFERDESPRSRKRSLDGNKTSPRWILMSPGLGHNTFCSKNRMTTAQAEPQVSDCDDENYDSASEEKEEDDEFGHLHQNTLQDAVESDVATGSICRPIDLDQITQESNVSLPFESADGHDAAQDASFDRSFDRSLPSNASGCLATPVPSRVRYSSSTGDNSFSGTATPTPGAPPSSISTKLQHLIIDSGKKCEPETKRCRRSILERRASTDVGLPPLSGNGGARSSSAKRTEPLPVKETPVLMRSQTTPCFSTPATQCGSRSVRQRQSGCSSGASAGACAATFGTPTPGSKVHLMPNKPVKLGVRIRRMKRLSGIRANSIEELDRLEQQPIPVLKDEEYDRLATKMKKHGVRMVAIDFDRTFVKLHTKSRWQGPVKKLAVEVRASIRAFALRCLRAGLRVAIATFSSQQELIEKLVHLIFPPEYHNNLLVVARNSTFVETMSSKGEEIVRYFRQRTRLTDKVYADRAFGKLPHIWLAMQKFAKRYSPEPPPCSLHHCVLIDDYEANITACQNTHVKAFHLVVERPGALFGRMTEHYCGEAHLSPVRFTRNNTHSGVFNRS